MKLTTTLLAVLCPLLIAAAPAPTFNRDIAPILYKNCANCHRQGEVAPFSLLTYQDAAKRAQLIATVTQVRLMPPWKAEPGHNKFLNERRLSDGEIAAIRDWAANGAPEGDAREKPALPTFRDGWQGGEPDQVIRLAQKVSVAADGPDQFRCFVLPLNAEQDEYVQKVEFRAGNRKVVHHSLLYLDTSGEARKMETAPGQGYPCVGGPGIVPAGSLGGWAPGAPPEILSDGLAYTIAKGADLVMQIHYHPSGKPEEDQSAVGLTFAKSPPTKGLLFFTLGNRKINIAPEDGHYVVKASATLALDAEAVAITPHAHYICKDMKVDAILPDGTMVPLIWIKDWDFNWQGQYRFAQALPLPKGTRLEMEYTYDNSSGNPHNPSSPPQRVGYGEQTTNEMAFAFVQLTLANRSLVPVFRREQSYMAIAQLLESGLDSANVNDRQAAQLKQLMRLFDKNGKGRLDADEKPALLEFLRQQR